MELFQKDYKLIICQRIKEAKSNFWRRENTKGLLLESFIDFFFRFQQLFTKFQHNYKLSLQNTTMSITF